MHYPGDGQSQVWASLTSQSLFQGGAGTGLSTGHPATVKVLRHLEGQQPFLQRPEQKLGAK